MKLLLERLQLDKDCTIGALHLDGEFECWTLEDVVRPVGAPKVRGKTAVPFGTYDVVITHSPRFKVLMPLLLNVPGFEGIRIHPGNTADNTEGCILVGVDRLGKSIGRSRIAYNALFAKLQKALGNKQRVTLEIVRGVTP